MAKRRIRRIGDEKLKKQRAILKSFRYEVQKIANRYTFKSDKKDNISKIVSSSIAGQNPALPVKIRDGVRVNKKWREVMSDKLPIARTIENYLKVAEEKAKNKGPFRRELARVKTILRNAEFATELKINKIKGSKKLFAPLKVKPQKRSYAIRYLINNPVINDITFSQKLVAIREYYGDRLNATALAKISGSPERIDYIYESIIKPDLLGF